MPSIEQSERIGGAAFLSIPALDSFIWVLDNYARIELLVKLHDQLPKFLTSPLTSFVCTCVGLILLYLSNVRQLRRVSETASRARLVDTSGVEYRSTEKPRWLLPVFISFAFALVTTPVLAIAYSLAYNGPIPDKILLPSPPYFAYTKTAKPSPTRRAIPESRIEQHSQGPNSPNVVGSNNQFSYSAEPPNRLLTASQQEIMIKRLGSVPPAAFWVTVESGDYDQGAEQVLFSRQLTAILEAAHWKRLEGGLALPSWQQRGQRDVIIATSTPALMASANGLSAALTSNLIRNTVRSWDPSMTPRMGFTGDYIVLLIGIQ
jgi:hypothetical protein